MISFWERETFLYPDVAIIGGGISGLSVAASLVEREPQLKIAVFERSLLPYGASTRNAGFACFGSLTELLSDIETMGQAAAIELLKKRYQGLQITRSRLGDEAIGFEETNGYEFIENDIESLNSKMSDLNALLADVSDHYFFDANHLKSRFGLGGSSRLIGMRGEGQVDTGALMDQLARHVTMRGVKIYSGSEASVKKAGDSFKITIDDGHRGAVGFCASRVVNCSNAFARQQFPEMDVKPGRGQVFITKPIDGISFRGNLHIDEGFYYLRNVGNRLLFGGGRNLDFKTEEIDRFELNGAIQSALEAKLKELFRPELTFEVDLRWSGIMAFGETKTPIVKEVEDGHYCAVKLSGMGIALAGAIGEAVTQLMLGR